MWRTPGLGISTRLGRIARTETTRSCESSDATMIGAVMPNVCTERHRSKNMPCQLPGSGRLRRPRARSRRLAGSSIVHSLPRGPRKVLRRIA